MELTPEAEEVDDKEEEELKALVVEDKAVVDIVDDVVDVVITEERFEGEGFDRMEL